MRTGWIGKPSAEQTAENLKDVFQKNGRSVTPFSIERGQKVIAAYSRPDQSAETHHKLVEKLLIADEWTEPERRYVRKCLGLEPIADVLDARLPSPIQRALIQAGPQLQKLARNRIETEVNSQQRKTLSFTSYFCDGILGYKQSLLGSASILHDAESRAYLDLQQKIKTMEVQSPFWTPIMLSEGPEPDVQGTVGEVLEPVAVGQALVLLENMVGLQTVKDAMKAFIARAKGTALEKRLGRRTSEEVNLHALFLGNPGVGKTAVAKLYGGLLRDAGLLRRGHVVVASKTDIVAGYVGQTGIKARNVIESAVDGVLLIDEAHALYEAHDQGFAREALVEFNTAMLTYNGRLAVIFATYQSEKDKVLSMENGLGRRFAKSIEFPDYTDRELGEILKRKVAASGLQVTEETALVIGRRIGRRRQNANFGNAGAVEAALDAAESARYLRLESTGALAQSESRGILPSPLLLLEDFPQSAR